MSGNFAKHIYLTADHLTKKLIKVIRKKKSIPNRLTEVQMGTGSLCLISLAKEEQLLKPLSLKLHMVSRKTKS